MSVFEIAAAVAIGLALLLLIDRHSLVAEMRRARREVKKLRKALVLEQKPAKRQPISKFVRRQVIERDNRKCSWCGRPGDSERDADGESWQMDHVIPLARGGSDHIGNLTLSCKRCNLKKGIHYPASLLAGVEWKTPADLETFVESHSPDADMSSDEPLLEDEPDSADEVDNNSEAGRDPANVNPYVFVSDDDIAFEQVATVITRIPRGRRPSPEEAAAMRAQYRIHHSKTRLCFNFYGYKDDDIWAFVNAALEHRI